MHALHYAVLSGNEELVELLVSLGGDRAAGIANGDGLYPLHMACSKGMAKAAAALCKIEGAKEVCVL
jgi:ankyrin repeat protein